VAESANFVCNEMAKLPHHYQRQFTGRGGMPWSLALNPLTQTMWWSDRSKGTIESADMSGGVATVLVTGLVAPGGVVYSTLDTDVSMDLVSTPSPAEPGEPYVLSINVSNDGNTVSTQFKLWLMVDGQVRMMMRLSPVLTQGFGINDRVLLSTRSLPDASIAFMALLTDTQSGKQVCIDIEDVTGDNDISELTSVLNMHSSPPALGGWTINDPSEGWEVRPHAFIAVEPDSMIPTTWGELKRLR